MLPKTKVPMPEAKEQLHTPNKKLHTIQKIKNTLLSFSSTRKLCQSIISDEYSSTSSSYCRSAIWRLQFITDFENSKQTVSTESLQEQEGIKINLNKLRMSRRDYDVLKQEFQVPWNQLPHDHEFYQPATAFLESDISEDLTKKQKLSRMSVNHDPLSTNTSSARKKTPRDIVTLETLIADVDRLFPQLPDCFINKRHNKIKVIEILYIWWKLNGGIYQQGIHELVGLIFIHVKNESVHPANISKRKVGASEGSNVELSPLEKEIVEFADSNYVCHDVFNIFNRFINLVVDKYYSETSLLQESIKFDIILHQLDKFQYILFKNRLKIDSTIFLLRYYRLLFIRELGLNSTVLLWDKLMAFGYLNKQNGDTQLNLTPLLPYITILLLSKIKAKTIYSDYGETLFMLLHYPIKPDTIHNLSQTMNKSATSESVRSQSPAIFISTAPSNCRSIDSNASMDNNNGKDSLEGNGNSSIDDISDMDLVYLSDPCNYKSSERFSNGSDRNDEENEEDDTVDVNIPQLVQDSIVLFRLKGNENEFMKTGSKIIEKYSGMVTEVSSKGKLSVSPVKKSAMSSLRQASPFLGNMLKRSLSSNKSKTSIQDSGNDNSNNFTSGTRIISSYDVNDLSDPLPHTTSQMQQLNIDDKDTQSNINQPNALDAPSFERTRLELRLQRAVKETIKKK
ncbi:unnamed protein product [[Candida] boidinii]|uniref:Unnamed protein product n=1 Tax=Candida boidinii TaxID=5477 RepID=A0ACB5TQ56_CANBO|nr:unnamed protein product [[Candida] boidinii]